MAKKSKKYKKPAQRDVIRITDPIRVEARRVLRSRLNYGNLRALDHIQDGRTFKPIDSRGPVKFDGRPVEYKLSTTYPPKDPTQAKIAFKDPNNVLVCRRRKRRRRTLFARGKIGSGKRVSPFRRRNINSDIKC